MTDLMPEKPKRLPRRKKPDPIRVPTRKISETIIDFGQPLIAQLSGDESLEVQRGIFKLIITIWNAHALAMPIWGVAGTLNDLGAALNGLGAPPEMLDACAALIRRRQLYFADDPRGVGNWELIPDAQTGVRLRCDARLPPTEDDPAA